jgi:hypothetical protein
VTDPPRTFHSFKTGRRSRKFRAIAIEGRTSRKFLGEVSIFGANSSDCARISSGISPLGDRNQALANVAKLAEIARRLWNNFAKPVEQSEVSLQEYSWDREKGGGVSCRKNPPRKLTDSIRAGYTSDGYYLVSFPAYEESFALLRSICLLEHTALTHQPADR